MKPQYLIAALAISASTFANAGVVNTVDATSAIAPNYFAPGGAATFNSPYYRGASEDWGWQHTGIASAFTTASLSISAFDVDAPPQSGWIGEIDKIYGYETSTSTWDFIGSLTGANNIYAFSTFNLGSSWFDEIASGLKLKIDIDTTGEGWYVTLAKSVITTDGANPGNPNPGAVPLPAAAWLFGSAAAGFLGLRRRKILA